MPPLRNLFCATIAGVSLWGCNAPPQPPEPTIEIGEKVEKLNAEIEETRVEANKRMESASEAGQAAKDAGPGTEADTTAD